MDEPVSFFIFREHIVPERPFRIFRKNDPSDIFLDPAVFHRRIRAGIEHHDPVRIPARLAFRKRSGRFTVNVDPVAANIREPAF